MNTKLPMTLLLRGQEKISGPCLGSITETNGFKESSKLILVKNATAAVRSVVVKEYRMSLLVVVAMKEVTEALKNHFPNSWKQLLVIAYCRFVYRCPLKSIPYRLESSFLCELLEMSSFTEKTSSGVLHETGGQMTQMQAYMKSFIAADDYILMDGTSIVSKSDHISQSKTIESLVSSMVEQKAAIEKLTSNIEDRKVANK